MLNSPPYQLLADIVLLLHFAVVVFVVGGPVVVVIGNRLIRWAWVNRLGFRLAHLAAIAFVALQAWLGATCPLTSLENWLRILARGQAYSGSFVEHWIQRILFYQAPGWVFAVAYTSFLLLVIGVWWIYPPASRTARLRTEKTSTAALRER